MRKTLVTLSLAALIAAPAAAYAADSTVTGAAGGAVAGAVVGGPVGAAVGGVIGAVVATAIEPPPNAVVAYVEQQPPPASITLQGNLVVGARLPATVTLYPVPPNVDPNASAHGYAYAVINGRTVIIDPRTYVVVGIVG